MVIVLDTNVIVSALLSAHGYPAEILLRWEAGEFDLVTSQSLLTELRRVLAYDRVKAHLQLSQAEIEAVLQGYRLFALFVEPQISLDVLQDDPDDNHVLECALAGNAAYIVSGDEHLLALGAYQGIVILSPASFITMLTLS
jgi:putative PIN family toxin of toxin-antitoxin system